MTGYMMTTAHTLQMHGAAKSVPWSNAFNTQPSNHRWSCGQQFKPSLGHKSAQKATIGSWGNLEVVAKVKQQQRGDKGFRRSWLTEKWQAYKPANYRRPLEVMGLSLPFWTKSDRQDKPEIEASNLLTHFKNIWAKALQKFYNR